MRVWISSSHLFKYVMSVSKSTSFMHSSLIFSRHLTDLFFIFLLSSLFFFCHINTANRSQSFHLSRYKCSSIPLFHPDIVHCFVQSFALQLLFSKFFFKIFQHLPDFFLSLICQISTHINTLSIWLLMALQLLCYDDDAWSSAYLFFYCHVTFCECSSYV